MRRAMAIAALTVAAGLLGAQGALACSSGRGRLYGLFVDRRNRRWHSNACQVVSPAQMRRAVSDQPGALNRGASIHPTVLLRCDLKI